MPFPLGAKLEKLKVFNKFEVKISALVHVGYVKQCGWLYGHSFELADNLYNPGMPDEKASFRGNAEPTQDHTLVSVIGIYTPNTEIGFSPHILAYT